jgi:hypothetical protein
VRSSASDQCRRRNAFLPPRISQPRQSGGPSSLERINVDTTIQSKAITHAEDSRLHHKAIEVLVRQAKRAGLRLRQSSLRLAKQARLKVQR